MAYTPMDYLGQYAQSQFEPIQNDFNNYMAMAQGDTGAWANQLGFETEEERKKRLREEARARGEIAPDDVVHTTTTKTYANGSQTETTKKEIPAPVEPTPSGAEEAAAAGAAGMSMAERAHQQEMAARAAPPPQAAPAPAATGPAVPEQLPAAAPAANAPQAGVPAPAVPAMPVPSQGVQVAGATQMPPAAPAVPVAPTQVGPTVTPTPPPPPAQPPAVSAAPPPAAVPAKPAEPAWMTAANDAGTNIAKLFDVAKAFPESQTYIMEKLKSQAANQSKEDEAKALFDKAKNGDLKAWNKIQQMIRPETGRGREEVTVGDYVKAFVFSELGLKGLSEEYQNKIRGKDYTFGQVQYNGQNWTARYDRQTGELIGARDDEGNVATKDTLNKLSAASMKAGTHAYGFTGERAIVPQGQPGAGEEVVPYTNAITGTVGYKYATGPLKNQEYTGSTPIAKSVQTQGQKAEQGKQIDLAYNPIIKAAERGAGFLGEFNAKHGTNFQIAGTDKQGKPIIEDQSTGRIVKPNERGVVTTMSGGGNRYGQTPAQIEQSMALGKKQAEANIELTKEVSAAEQKVPAEAKGTIAATQINNQNMANEYHGLMQPIANLIKKSTGSGIGASVDTIASKFGVGTEGGAAIAELNQYSAALAKNVPRFKGSDSDRDVKLYQQMAGNFNDPTQPISYRLAALKGMINLMKKYDKEGKNDWTYGGGGGEIKIISRERVQ